MGSVRENGGMAADFVHLVRHGEVENPEGILYGRLPGYGLSGRGRRMAQAAAESFDGRQVAAIVASPLQRTQESAAPWAALFELEPVLDERVIEPWNAFEGTRVRRAIARNPFLLWRMRNPRRPSWGEPFAAMRDRMLAAMDAAADSVDHGDVVIVSHQAPIETVARAIEGKPLPHNPAQRRTRLSSITTFRRDPDTHAWTEVGYQEPAAGLLGSAIDTGAV